jgi:hypothetical protein
MRWQKMLWNSILTEASSWIADILIWLQAKHYQIQRKKKEEEMAELRTKRDKGVLTAKDYENECLRVSQAYPLVQDTPNKWRVFISSDVPERHLSPRMFQREASYHHSKIIEWIVMPSLVCSDGRKQRSLMVRIVHESSCTSGDFGPSANTRYVPVLPPTVPASPSAAAAAILSSQAMWNIPAPHLAVADQPPWKWWASVH